MSKCREFRCGSTCRAGSMNFETHSIMHFFFIELFFFLYKQHVASCRPSDLDKSLNYTFSLP